MPSPKKQPPSSIAAHVAKKLLESPKYLENLQTRLDAGILPSAVETMLWDRAYGKTAEMVTVTHQFEELEKLSDAELDILEQDVRNLPVM